MFYLYGTAISPDDGAYLLNALAALKTTDAFDASVMIALGLTGRRDPVPLSPDMQDAVRAALEGDPPGTLVDLRRRVARKSLRIKEW